ncbi:MAG: M28 family peptidase [Planctomycetes bacterium]|nr:M28 family peptidase [Planctomycetota bacterium]
MIPAPRITVLILGLALLGACGSDRPARAGDPEVAGEVVAPPTPEPTVTGPTAQPGPATSEDRGPESAGAVRTEATSGAAFHGFGLGRIGLERQAETQLRALARAERCEKDLRELTRLPHVAGGERNAELAGYLARQLELAGFQVERRAYDVLLPYPRSISVEMEQPVAYSASLVEETADWHLEREQRAIQPYSAYSPDCDLSAGVVYVNYASREDFDTLTAMGIDCRGAILIARYGKIFRGSKVALAEEHGAAGMILYSDPADDGFARGDVYPKGPFRPFTGVERGSILRIWEYPGDPGTPGRPSLPGADQLTYGEMRSLPLLPTTAISAADAAPILENLGGPIVPAEWRGALPSTYHVGGQGKVRLRLRIESEYGLRRIENVIGTLPGLRYPDEYVVLGNHRDAWVHGAIDPGSGTAVLLEVARVLGERRAIGGGLDRSLRICFWDAEEFGMIGSTEYGEERADELARETVAYVNVDAAVSGPQLRVAGVPSLTSFMAGLLADVPGPDGKPRLDSLLDSTGELRMGGLGAGSDYTVFLARLGIPALDLSSGGANGVYHSSYDTFAFMKRFGDPDFEIHRSMAGLIATVAMRLGRAELLPFDFVAASRALVTAAERLEKKDPRLELAELREIATRAEEAGRRINEARQALLERGLDIQRTMKMNAALAGVERKLLLAEGLRRRPWYRHCLYAPARERGYGSSDLPPLSDALEAGDRDEAQAEALRLMTALRAWLAELESIAAALERR